MCRHKKFISIFEQNLSRVIKANERYIMLNTRNKLGWTSTKYIYTGFLHTFPPFDV